MGPGRDRPPGAVVLGVAATSLLIWHLSGALRSGWWPVGEALAAYLLLGLLDVLTRYALRRRPVVFLQDVAAELAVYALAGAACGAALWYIWRRWGVTADPVWSALAVYLVLALAPERRHR